MAIYNIFDHKKISDFISECNQILKGTKHSFNYTINCQAYIGQEEIKTRTTNKKEYILTNASSNYVTLKLLKVGQETIDTIYINDVKNVSTSSNEFYVMNYEQDAKTIKNLLMMIRIFVSYSQVYQYILSRKKEIELLHILGISKKDLIYLYTQHLIFLLFLSILFSSISKSLI